MAERWEHLTVDIGWDQQLQQWRSDWSEDCSHKTCDGILNAVGDAGWELVSFAPYFALVVAAPVPDEVDKHFWAGSRYWAVFKRRKA